MNRTHTELVECAARWLLGSQRCGVVITEMASQSPEHPDAIGWRGWESILIECKTSRSDFFADKHKHFRKNGNSRALGTSRFFLTPPGLVTPAEVSAQTDHGWGLLETSGKTIRTVMIAHGPQKTDRTYEVLLLMSALRRIVAEPGVRGMNCRVYQVGETDIARAAIWASEEPSPIEMKASGEE